jgi:hypothetical protein
MLNKNTIGYSCLAVAAVVTTTLFLNTGLAEVTGDKHSASIITSIVVSFAIGVLLTLLVIYFGAALRPATQTNKEQPPHKLFIYNTSDTTQISTSPALTTFGTSTHEAPTVIVENGIARTLNTSQNQKNTAVIEWVEYDERKSQNVYRSIDVQTLRRFARLHTPSRSEWSGKATTYSECLAFFRFSGWVIPATVGNGVEWNFIYKRLQRRLQHLGDLATISQTANPPFPKSILSELQPAKAFSWGTGTDEQERGNGRNRA